jgi:hypothetical protein
MDMGRGDDGQLSVLCDCFDCLHAAGGMGLAVGDRWIIFKDGNHWTVAKRNTRSFIRGLPYRVWFHTRTGAEALAVFADPALRTEIGYG